MAERLKIFADENILALESNFSHRGELHLFDGRSVQREELLSADVLLVRSITEVNKSLLEGTKIRFVGTATSGIDHIDTEYLCSAGIGFADAKGSNANAVVDYCFAALACAALHNGFSLQRSRVGIVGAGSVGGLFATKLEQLGVEVLCCDPLLANSGEGNREYCSLDEALACDVVSLHVPLTVSTSHPTKNLLDSQQLAVLKKGAILLNACRGGVVNETALAELLERRDDIYTVFDVWDKEPKIDRSLARSIDIATPHIAGYSKEAKSNATQILAAALENHLGHSFSAGQENSTKDYVSVDHDVEQGAKAHWATLLSVFALDRLSENFKRAISAGSGAEAFDSFRRDLRQRREFLNVQLAADDYSSQQQEFLAVLGFRFD
jgi:erythronate-4-phosphate dehydrogenase